MKSKRLLEIKKTQSTNKNIEEIISNFRPQIFWKEKDIVKNQTNKWNLKDTEKLVYKINEVEMTVKKNYTSALNIVSDFVLSSAK